MQNAKYHHVQQAKGFTPPLNVMFIVEHPEWGSIKAHIKSVLLEVNKFVGLTMESAGGSKFFAEYEWLKPVPRERGSQPKAKRKPQKGTKPWLAKFEYVDYDPNLMAPGVKVKCRDKKVRIVSRIGYDYIVFEGCSNSVDKQSGAGNFMTKTPYFCDIMKIIVEKSVENTVNDKYNGYAPNVWHFWQGASKVPPVDGDVEVQCWVRMDKQECAEIVKAQWLRWEWSDRYPTGDIIAFRIVE